MGLKKKKENNEDFFKKLESSDISLHEKEDIKNAIVDNNRKLIHYCIRKLFPDVDPICSSYKITYSDLEAEGLFGLIKAMGTFDIGKGFKFISYATMAIKNQILMFLRNNKKHQDIISIDEHMYEDRDGSQSNTLLDTLGVFDNDIEECSNRIYNQQFLEILLQTLSEKEREIIKLYYFKNMKMGQIGKVIGYTQSYISRILQLIHAKGKKLYNTLENGESVVNMKRAIIPELEEAKRLLIETDQTVDEIAAITGANKSSIQVYQTKLRNGRRFMPVNKIKVTEVIEPSKFELCRIEVPANLIHELSPHEKIQDVIPDISMYKKDLEITAPTRVSAQTSVSTKWSQIHIDLVLNELEKIICAYKLLGIEYISIDITESNK